MIIDARQIEEGDCITCDICIVGAGAAGITLASEFLNQNIKVVLLESGGFKLNQATEQLNQGEVDVDIHGSLGLNRHRQLGGTTATWGGRCVPFDPIDFTTRSYVPYSGWPITRQELEPYYQRAHSYCELGPYADQKQTLLPAANRKQAMISGFQSDEILLDDLYLFSPPTNFGKRYAAQLKQSNHVSVYLHANCLKVTTTAMGDRVKSLQVASLNKNYFSVVAKHYVLAAGGLEVTRLLLLSHQVHGQSIGHQHDALGRFYMSHLNYRVDLQFTPEADLIWDYEQTAEGIYCQRSIAISPLKQQQAELLNQRAFIERPDISNPNHRNGILSATYLAKTLLNPQARSHHLHQHGHNIIRDVGNLLPFSHKWVSKRMFSSRKLPSVISKNDAHLYTLRFDSEQAPNPNSRMMLSSGQDEFGLNQLKVDWQVTEMDTESIRKSVQFITQAFAQAGIAKIVSLPEITCKPQGGHYLGTTRMANTPYSGVVDKNCQVHGVSNLFIASSSVFPTASYANPTLTIVALTLRLADHLKQAHFRR